MSRTVVVLLLLISAEARGEGPLRIAAGAGPAAFRLERTSIGHGLELGASARLDAGYRVADNVAVGAHVGIAYLESEDRDDIAGPTMPITSVPFELGVGAQLVIADRVLIAPWLGLLDTADWRYFAAGVGLGFDVLERGHDRISAVATFTTARRSFRDNPETYESLGVGIAYRYW